MTRSWRKPLKNTPSEIPYNSYNCNKGYKAQVQSAVIVCEESEVATNDRTV